MRSKVLLELVVVFLVLTSLSIAPREAGAASGTVHVNPGETEYVSFGPGQVDDLILWSFSISTWSTIFTYWLERPDNTHLSVDALTWGRVIEQAGTWRLGFSIDPSGFWDATVTYSVLLISPSIDISSPSNAAYVNTTALVVAGTTEGYADEVAISIDAVHYEKADLYLGSWTKHVALAADGQYTITAEETFKWGSYWAKYYDSVIIVLDTVLPNLLILHPQQDAYIPGDYWVSWQSSDDQSVGSTEARVDALGWQTMSNDSLHIELSDGPHIVQVRVRDVAGNAVVNTVSFVADSGLPQVSITGPEMNSKISKDTVVITWTGSDLVSGIDHYEVQITGGQWVNVGTATSYEFTNLDDAWYGVTVKAVDKAGNAATSTVGFGIYTSIWSQNGPYHGIPLYALVAGIIVAALLGYVLIQRRWKHPEPPHEKSP